MSGINKVLDLTDTNNTENLISYIKYEKFKFSGGEPHIKLIDFKPAYYQNINIICDLSSSHNILTLMMAVSAIRNANYRNNLNLEIKYFPGGRQDRVMMYGEPLSVKVYSSIINSLNFDEVSVFDPHSDVTSALLNNCKVINNHHFVFRALNKFIGAQKIFNLISPDSGSNKKIKELAKYLNKEGFIFNIVKCDKTRDVTTGNITGFEVYSENLEKLPSVIVDDICDGGGTFLGLAEKLKEKNAGELSLIVSHGIFSKGFKPLLKVFKKIYTSNSFGTERFYDGTESYNQGVKVKNLEIIKI